MPVLGASSGGNDLYSVPTSWPWSVGYFTRLNAYYINLVTMAPTVAASDTTAFWTEMGLRGALDSAGSRTADTYRTQVDITGEGHMGSIIFPMMSGSSGTNTARITVDGTEYICKSALIATNLIGVVGFIDLRKAQSNTNTDLGSILTPSGSGITSGDFHSYTSSFIVLPPLIQQIALGTPTIRFKQSLKVEIKQSVTSHPSSAYSSSAVNYILTGDVS